MAVGSVPQGQGHETVAAQVVADVLNVHPDMVAVRTGFDTDRNVHTGFTGTYASQFAVSGLSAVHGAAQRLKAEMLRLAAFVLQAQEADLELGLGKQGPEVRVRGTEKSISFMGLANIVSVNSAILPEELYEITLNCRYTWRAPFKIPDVQRKYGNLTLTYSAQLHIAVIEIDRETCDPELLNLCGRRRLRHGDQSQNCGRPGTRRHRARHWGCVDGKLRIRHLRQHAYCELQRLHSYYFGQHPSDQGWIH